MKKMNKKDVDDIIVIVLALLIIGIGIWLAPYILITVIVFWLVCAILADKDDDNDKH